MSGGRGESATTRVTRLVRAPRGDIYAAFLDPQAVTSWLPPRGMRGVVHEFEPRVGGRLRMSLVYEDPADGQRGKTTENTDTFEGRFVELVADERVAWAVEFESGEPGMSGEMRVTWTLADAEDGTEVAVVCGDIPRGIRLEDNERGSASSLEQLARLVEK